MSALALSLLYKGVGRLAGVLLLVDPRGPVFQVLLTWLFVKFLRIFGFLTQV